MKRDWTFIHNGIRYSASIKLETTSRSAHGKAFVFMEDRARPTVDEISEAARKLGFKHAYTERGESKEVDRLWDEHNRDVIERQRELIYAALDAGGYGTGGDNTMRFSRKAGCSCGCSPGFITSLLPPADELFISEIKGESVGDRWVEIAEAR